MIGGSACRRELFEELIDGMQMDLDQNRYARFRGLERYCHRVAGVVGLLSAEIFGYSIVATLDYAHDLGIAFQLTNIIRDVGEDARRDTDLPAARRPRALGRYRCRCSASTGDSRSSWR